jgi:hypothetical protein
VGGKTSSPNEIKSEKISLKRGKSSSKRKKAAMSVQISKYIGNKTY